ncbi:MAG: HD domain-containing protein, partial [Gemmatimonadales bacterium]
IERVAALIDRWAAEMRLPEEERARWGRAAWLHDALRDASAAELKRWGGTSDAPEELLHGPAAAARARSEGETDQGLLDAVRYHSIGSDTWDAVGRALYCADFLEPGRSFEREARAALADRFPSDPDGVFREVVRTRFLWLIRSGWPLPDPTVRLWNALATSR